jgi:hypothetical protein
LAENRRGERQGKRRDVIASGGDQEDVPESLGQVLAWSGVVVEAL